MAGCRLTWLACLALTLVASKADADTSRADRTLAQSLFEQGRQLMDAKNYAAACAKFAESQRLDPSAGTLLNLAVCHERADKLATAWAEYGDAATAARHAGEGARASFADEQARALGPKLAHLTIRVPSSSGLTIKLDGAEIGSAAWGTPLPADVGPHRVVALRDGRKAWETTKEVSSDGESLRIDVPASTDSPVQPDTEAAADSTPSHLPAYLALGAGGAGLVVGAIFGIKALSDNSSLSGVCNLPGNGCPSQYQPQIDQLDTDRIVAGVGFGVAVVGGVLGTYLLLSSSSTPSAQAQTGRHRPLRVSPQIGARWVGIGGAF